MRRKNSLDAVSHLFGQLKEMFSGASIRQVAGIRDVGEVFVGNVENATGQGADGPNMIHKTSRDVWTHVIDGLTGHSVLARLYAPAGALWRLPKKGDGAHVIRGRKMNGPGGPLAMVDGGDGSTDNVVPQWLSKDLCGISVPEGFEIESTGDKVIIKANSGGTSASVTLNKDGSIDLTPAAGKTVNVAGTGYSLTKTEDLFTDMATFISAVIADLASAAAAPVATYTATVSTTNLFAKMVTGAGAAYKSQNAKNG